jgi:purine-binding chemotaxis protein CheW
MEDNKKVQEPTRINRTLQIVVFKLGSEEYGIQIDQIKEVVLTPNITRMPQTPSYVKGVANIRGNVIAIFDLEEKFNFMKRDDHDKCRYTLVVESDEFKMGLMVNEVPNTISVNAADLDESVGIINDASATTNYIKGVIKHASRLIILVDVFKVIDVDVASGIRKATAA